MAESLLVELLTEELPPKALRALGEVFADRILNGLVKANLKLREPGAIAFATPRRLAVLVPDVLPKAQDRTERIKLMPAKVAFNTDGKPSPALLKRLDKEPGGPSVLVANVQRSLEGNVEYAIVELTIAGASLAQGLQDALDDAISKLPIPKMMSYQRPDGTTVKFVRPAHRLVALHGADVVSVSALGLEAGRITRGHRFIARAEIEVASAEAYAPTLAAEGKVVASFAERRARIVAELAVAARGAKVVMPDELVDEVTALVEWPRIYTGGFDLMFLDVPPECLILTMQRNQRYFALADADGKLQNRFLLVSNIDPHDPEPIIRGNERVLRARLADAKFFYDQDRKFSLESRVPRLAHIVYHSKLGSQGERVVRLGELARRIAAEIGADPVAAERAALLAKADLVTEMVGEFPELQGVMGRYYALHDGEPAAVADAIAQHYWPRFAGDAIPEGPVARALALADKLEALAGLFAVGAQPTGDKDPFGLRRAAIGVLRILIDARLAVDLRKLIDLAQETFSGVPALRDASADVEAFIHDRLRAYLREQGYTANQVEAVMSPSPTRVDLVRDRLAAVQSFVAMPEAEALASANKRIVNILKKSGADAAPAVDRSLFADGAEQDLFAEVQKLLPVVHRHVERGEYTEALRALASARASVDRFFDDVLVMAEDPALRANRLALLRGLAEAMNQVADISKLAV